MAVVVSGANTDLGADSQVMNVGVGDADVDIDFVTVAVTAPVGDEVWEHEWVAERELVRTLIMHALNPPSSSLSGVATVDISLRKALPSTANCEAELGQPRFHCSVIFCRAGDSVIRENQLAGP